MTNRNSINVHHDTTGRESKGNEVARNDYKRLPNQGKTRQRRGLSAKQLLARKLSSAARQTNRSSPSITVPAHSRSPGDISYRDKPADR